MHPKTRQAIEEIRPNPHQAHDEQTMAMIRESAKKLYGWDWPPQMGLQ